MKSKKMLLGVISIIALSLVVFTSAGAGAVYKGDVPTGIQGSFFTGNYACIYLHGSESIQPMVANQWSTYSVDVNKSVGYNSRGSKCTGFSKFRIQAYSKKSNMPVAIYIDRITLKSPTGIILMDYTFDDGENHGPYFSKGKKSKGNGTIVDVDGKKCFVLYGKTQKKDGATGFEVQWDLPKPNPEGGALYNFKTPGYILTFSYFVAQ